LIESAVLAKPFLWKIPLSSTKYILLKTLFDELAY